VISQGAATATADLSAVQQQGSIEKIAVKKMNRG
jgi:hypothetical protein